MGIGFSSDNQDYKTQYTLGYSIEEDDEKLSNYIDNTYEVGVMYYQDCGTAETEIDIDEYNSINSDKQVDCNSSNEEELEKCYLTGIEQCLKDSIDNYDLNYVTLKLKDDSNGEILAISDNENNLWKCTSKTDCDVASDMMRDGNDLKDTGMYYIDEEIDHAGAVGNWSPSKVSFNTKKIVDNEYTKNTGEYGFYETDKELTDLKSHQYDEYGEEYDYYGSASVIPDIHYQWSLKDIEGNNRYEISHGWYKPNETTIEGCMDSEYTEYNINATIDDGSCQTLIVNDDTNTVVSSNTEIDTFNSYYPDSFNIGITINNLESDDIYNQFNIVAIIFDNIENTEDNFDYIHTNDIISINNETYYTLLTNDSNNNDLNYDVNGYITSGNLIVYIQSNGNINITDYGTTDSSYIIDDIFTLNLVNDTEYFIHPFDTNIHVELLNNDISIYYDEIVLKDCNGDEITDENYAYKDDCEDCVGGSTGLLENYNKDCYGDCSGDAYIDDCGDCVEGNTGNDDVNKCQEILFRLYNSLNVPTDIQLDGLYTQEIIDIDIDTGFINDLLSTNDGSDNITDSVYDIIVLIYEDSLYDPSKIIKAIGYILTDDSSSGGNPFITIEETDLTTIDTSGNDVEVESPGYVILVNKEFYNNNLTDIITITNELNIPEDDSDPLESLQKYTNFDVYGEPVISI